MYSISSIQLHRCVRAFSQRVVWSRFFSPTAFFVVPSFSTTSVNDLLHPPDSVAEISMIAGSSFMSSQLLHYIMFDSYKIVLISKLRFPMHVHFTTANHHFKKMQALWNQPVGSNSPTPAAPHTYTHVFLLRGRVLPTTVFTVIDDINCTKSTDSLGPHDIKQYNLYIYAVSIKNTRHLRV